MAWQEPSDASAYCTGFAATSAPPSAGGSSTLKVWVPVRTSTSVMPTSVPWALKTACAFAASSATALRVSAMSMLSVTSTSGRESLNEPIVYKNGLFCQEPSAGWKPSAHWMVRGHTSGGEHRATAQPEPQGLI